VPDKESYFMTQQSDLATMFLLTGGDLKISYYINEDNSSELDYQDSQGSLTFPSDKLHIQESALGTLITASLKNNVLDTCTPVTSMGGTRVTVVRVRLLNFSLRSFATSG